MNKKAGGYQPFIHSRKTEINQFKKTGKNEGERDYKERCPLSVSANLIKMYFFHVDEPCVRLERAVLGMILYEEL